MRRSILGIQDLVVSSWRPSIRQLVDGNAAINKQSAAKTQQKGKEMLSTKTKKLDDYYGSEKQSFIGYELDKKLRKRFVIEYCDDERKLERLGLRSCHGGLEIDDVYHQIILEETESDRFDSFDGIAMASYISCYLSKNILDVKMYEQVYDGSEMIQERYIEPPSTLTSIIESMVIKEVKAKAQELEREVKYLEEENKRMHDFITKYHADDVYRRETA